MFAGSLPSNRFGGSMTWSSGEMIGQNSSSGPGSGMKRDRKIPLSRQSELVEQLFHGLRPRQTPFRGGPSETAI